MKHMASSVLYVDTKKMLEDIQDCPLKLSGQSWICCVAQSLSAICITEIQSLFQSKHKWQGWMMYHAAH